MPRSGSYLYKRKGSQNWWLRLYLPGTRGKTKFEMSLGTPDRTEAEVIASEPIRGHKLLLIGRRSQVTGFGPRWEPGEHFLKDGTRIVATKKEVAVFELTGREATDRQEQDGFQVQRKRSRCPSC